MAQIIRRWYRAALLSFILISIFSQQQANLCAHTHTHTRAIPGNSANPARIKSAPNQKKAIEIKCSLIKHLYDLLVQFTMGTIKETQDLSFEGLQEGDDGH